MSYTNEEYYFPQRDEEFSMQNKEPEREIAALFWVEDDAVLREKARLGG